MNSKCILLLGLLLAACGDGSSPPPMIPPPVQQFATCELQWEWNYPPPLTVSFRVYDSTVSGQYSLPALTTTNLRASCAELQLPVDNQVHYWIVKSVSVEGVESLPSNEVSKQLTN